MNQVLNIEKTGISNIRACETVRLKEQFHAMFDAFPGPVRLIDRSHQIVAAILPGTYLQQTQDAVKGRG